MKEASGSDGATRPGRTRAKRRNFWSVSNRNGIRAFVSQAPTIDLRHEVGNERIQAVHTPLYGLQPEALLVLWQDAQAVDDRPLVPRRGVLVGALERAQPGARPRHSRGQHDLALA